MVKGMIGKVVWISLGTLVFLALLAAFVGNFWLGRYLRSEPFREMVSQRASNALKVDGQFDRLRWEGSSVYSEDFRATGRPGQATEAINANRIRANFNFRSLLNGEWRLEELDIGRLEVDFAGAAAPAAPPEVGDIPAPVKGTEMSLPSWIPTRFSLGKIQAESASFRAPGGTLTNSSLQARLDGNIWQINGRGGELQLSDFPLLKMKDFSLRISDDTIYLTSSEATLGRSGVVRGSGEVIQRSRRYGLRFDWQNVATQDVLPEKAKAHLQGILRGEAVAEGSNESPGKVTGNFYLSDGLIEGLKVLDQLATFTGTPQFKRMALQEVSGNFTTSQGATSISQFVLESKGLLRVEGTFTVGADDSLEGDLEVGLSNQTLRWLPGSRERVFTTSRNGYVWAPLRLGGTIHSPTENLSARLAGAVAAQTIETGADVIRQSPDAVREGINTALDILSPLMP